MLAKHLTINDISSAVQHKAYFLYSLKLTPLTSLLADPNASFAGFAGISDYSIADPY